MNKLTTKHKRNTSARERAQTRTAWTETLALYHAWLGYLLEIAGKKTLRVKAQEIRRALGRLSCRVTREGDEYVIQMEDRASEDITDASADARTDVAGTAETPKTMDGEDDVHVHP